DEARKFARTRLASLEPSREPKLLAGIIAGVRTQMTQRGKILIVTLDDASAALDVTVYHELYEENKKLFKEGEFLAVQGKVAEDRFFGGLRITAEKVMDIAAARSQYGRQLVLSITQSSKTANSKQLQSVLTPHLSQTGLPLILHYRLSEVDCELLLGDEWRVSPDDTLWSALSESFGRGVVAVEY
ncbi:MAG: OB-fold nucleic acid binding domain-containing protein, partial [Herbaspirillum sp.]